MQGGNRAPRLIKALEEGPSMGLMTGWARRHYGANG